jgi:REP element-mobilizing transposase RayT
VYFATWRLVKGVSLLDENERDIIQQALLHFNEQRYVIYAYVVMDDHVHVVFRPEGKHQVSQLMHSWKSYTAHEIQRRRGAKGNLWLHESWDRIIRDEDELIEKCQYVLANPLRRWPEMREYPWVGHQ